jgi:DNA uptake protein ComE-like DNA-binding protein
VLIRDANGTAQVGDRCRVTAGQWYSPFDDVHLTAPGSIDIDHFVPLAEAWRSGADNWDAATRRRFANDLEDPRTLIAVTASSNRSKGDKDPANWLPPHSAYRCTYVGTWVAIKHRWQLAVDSREHSAIQRVLSGCGPLRTAPTAPTNVAIAPAPTSSAPATTTTTPATAPAPTTAPTTTAPPTTTVPAGPCVNINTAASADLERIIHVGPARAQDIISLRPFSSVDDLARVSGISTARLADIKDQGLACT